MFRDADYTMLADHGNPPIVPYSSDLDDVFSRFNFASDLHIDFEKVGDGFFIENPAPTLILSGDIGEVGGYNKPTFIDFFKRCSEHWNDVIVISGNHEHYRSTFEETIPKMREVLKEFTNITVLDKTFIEIDGVIILGATLWTNFNNEDVVAMSVAGSMMNDYRCIKTKNEPHRLTPHRTFHEHEDTVVRFKKILERYPDKPFIVVSHHAPSMKSVDPNYIHETHLNHAYASDLEGFIHAHPNIIHWIHGHMHTRMSYQVGSTTVHVRARGYPDQFEDYRSFMPGEIFV